MAAPKLISVVLCTYEGAAFLAEQLKSLLVQSRLPDEIVIGDDASTDRTWDIVEAFKVDAKARGVSVLAFRRPVRLGYVNNFSATLAAATGELVFLCDQDDSWHPDKIATMCARFDRDPTLTFLHSDARLVDASGRDLGHSLFEALELSSVERDRLRDGQAFGVYLRRNIATGAASAFRRRLLDIALPIPIAWVHDAWLAILAAATGRTDVIDDALIDYRQHGGNQIGMRPRDWRTRLRELTLPCNASIADALARLDVLIERIEQETGDAVALQGIVELREHLAARLAMGNRSPVARVPSIAKEFGRGHYDRYGTGLRMVLRDVMRKKG